MKQLIRILVLTLVATATLGVVGTVTRAQVVTDQQLERIATNCLFIKESLNQLHASDALLRVNRGQLYESMSIRLMERFNSRVTSNGVAATGLQAVTQSYGSALASFRTDYQLYERQLSAALRIDCEREPALFYAAVLDARTKRSAVHVSVLRLHRYIEDYRLAANDFLLNYERLTGKTE